MKASIIALAVLATLAAGNSEAATVEEQIKALGTSVAALKQEIAQLKSALSFLGRDATGNVSITATGGRNDLVQLNGATTIGASSTVSIGADSNTTIGRFQKTQIGQSRSVDVGGSDVLKVVGSHTTNIGTNQTQMIAGSRAVTMNGSDQLQVSGNATQQVAGHLGTTVAKTIIIEAGDQITFKTGDSSIILLKNGDITISGKNVDIKSSGDVLIKGSKILAN